ncbi:MAG: DUF433 domain-containing protein [Thermoguttaceae bacterium]
MNKPLTVPFDYITRQKAETRQIQQPLVERTTSESWELPRIFRTVWTERAEYRLARRLREAVVMLQNSVEINPQKRGGVPVLKGTRVTIAQVIAELSDDLSLSEIADDLGLDEMQSRCFLEGMAIHLDRPFVR